MLETARLNLSIIWFKGFNIISAHQRFLANYRFDIQRKIHARATISVKMKITKLVNKTDLLSTNKTE